jgi:hypothetical protein
MHAPTIRGANMISTAEYIDKQLERIWKISAKDLVAAMERLGYVFFRPR